MDLTKNRFFLLATAFSTGACIMVLELTASRVLAPAFGSSIYVWGSLIGVIMTALALGYYTGGYFADKTQDIRFLYKILILAAITVSLIPILGESVLAISLLGGFVLGPIISTVVIFSIPMTLLAMTSPMVIKFSTDKMSSLGLSAGKVYSVSTVGSILGTFITTFILIPMAGSRLAILATAAVVFALGMAGLLKKKYLPLALLLIPGLLYNPPAENNLIYKTESAYNIIKVLDYPDMREMKLNYEYAIQSRINKKDILVGGYFDYVNLGPLLTRTDKILWIGAGAGTSPRQLSYFYNATIDAVEIDPEIVEVGKEYFSLQESDEIRIHVSDGRDYLRNSGKYGIINIDVFGGGFDLPFHMATREFFAEASKHLEEDGLVTMNSMVVYNDDAVSNAIAYTMRQVFPSVFTIDLGWNRMIIGFKKKKALNEVRESLRGYDPKLENIVKDAKANIKEFNPENGVILTDDKSQVEEMTFNMMRKYYEVRH